MQRLIVRDAANKVLSDDTFTVQDVPATRVTPDSVVFPGDESTPVA